jgi:metallo-beta-lactamase family protein
VATLRFLGAARNVTGSCYLLETDGVRLLVDCGLFQERKFQGRNWNPFPVPPSSIHTVLLTHAHLDHCGLIPKLMKEGFRGKVWCTAATAEVARYVLLDSARLQEEDAEFKRARHEREGRSGPHPPAALYTEEEAQRALSLFTPLPYGRSTEVAPGLAAVFQEAGHILGSASVRVEYGRDGARRSILFSGDVGRWDRPIIRDPAVVEPADYIVMESTYGGSRHEDPQGIERSLAEAVTSTARAGGNLLIPSFALERTQEVLYYLNRLLAAKRIPHVLVFVDSPMAVDVTEVFLRHADLFDEEMRRLMMTGASPFAFPGLTMVRSVEQSKSLNHLRGTAVIVAGSGMCTGGRIKHHLAANLDRRESMVLFVGYQAEGTLGREILRGAKVVRLQGRSRRVRARISRITGFSAHADQEELARWLSPLRNPPRRLFLTHGEPEAAEALAAFLRARRGWQATIPSYGEVSTLE